VYFTITDVMKFVTKAITLYGIKHASSIVLAIFPIVSEIVSVDGKQRYNI
jgi:hypothetical protein